MRRWRWARTFDISLFIRHRAVTKGGIHLCRREKSQCLRHVRSFYYRARPKVRFSQCISLQTRQELEWHSKVKLLLGDMRSLNIPEKADILVTELLGSFGDNELSPECLDGAVRFLKRECSTLHTIAMK
jgi:hypothetical protein